MTHIGTIEIWHSPKIAKGSAGARTKSITTSWTNALSKTSVTIEEMVEMETIAKKGDDPTIGE